MATPAYTIETIEGEDGSDRPSEHLRALAGRDS
jgi:hypothetical protein